MTNFIEEIRRLDKERTKETTFLAESEMFVSDWVSSAEYVGFSVERDGGEPEFDILIEAASEADAQFIAKAPQMANALIEIADYIDTLIYYGETFGEKDAYGKGFDDALKAVKQDLIEIINQQGEGDEEGKVIL